VKEADWRLWLSEEPQYLNIVRQTSQYLATFQGLVILYASAEFQTRLFIISSKVNSYLHLDRGPSGNCGAVRIKLLGVFRHV